ncbi:hypothetical protein GCM10009085_48440 [Pseudomonas avellanae]|nr:hypothetical protein GCM10009085_48440 [Pseudomonas avellanae]
MFCPWRDLLKEFGSWSKIYKRFNAWSASGKWFKVLEVLRTDPDLEWVFVDGSYAKAHQHSAGAASTTDQAIGKRLRAISQSASGEKSLRPVEAFPGGGFTI